MSRALRTFLPAAAVVVALAAWGASPAAGVPAEDRAPAPEDTPTPSERPIAEARTVEVTLTAGRWDQGIVQCIVEGPGGLWVVSRFGKHAEPVRVGPFKATEITLQDTPGAACDTLVGSAAAAS